MNKKDQRIHRQIHAIEIIREECLEILRNLSYEAVEVAQLFYEHDSVLLRHALATSNLDNLAIPRKPLTVSVSLDERRISLRIRWMQAKYWRGNHGVTQGENRRRPVLRGVAMSKKIPTAATRGRTYNVTKLVNTAPIYQQDLVRRTEENLALLRRKARIVGNTTKRLCWIAHGLRDLLDDKDQSGIPDTSLPSGLSVI